MLRTLAPALTAAVALLALAPSALPAQDKPTVVDYKSILPLLPSAPSGWTAKKPEGNTLRMGPVQLTNASAEFTKDASKVKISIIDYAVQRDVMKGLSASWQFANESSEGYAKTISVDGFNGYETWVSANKQLNIFLIVAERYWVHVELQGEAPESGREWLGKVNLKALAALK